MCETFLPFKRGEGISLDHAELDVHTIFKQYGEFIFNELLLVMKDNKDKVDEDMKNESLCHFGDDGQVNLPFPFTRRDISFEDDRFEDTLVK